MFALAAALPLRAMVVTYALLATATLVLRYMNGVDEHFGGDTGFIVLFTVSHLVGALVASRRPRNPVGWLLAGAAFVALVALFADQYARYGIITAPSAAPAARYVYWLATWPWIGMFAGVVFTALLFPDGRLPSPRWRPFAWSAGMFMTVFAAMFAFAPVVGADPALENPFAIEALRATGKMLETTVGFVTVLALLAGTVLSLLVRFRRSHGLERQQLKWAASAVAVTVVGFVLGDLLDGVLADVAVGAALIALPLAIGVAMLRYRLYDIDVLINRTLVYGALTALLAATYFGAVVLIQALLRPFTAGSELAVAASTLLVVALFQPIRRRVQDFVDHRFYRSRYDAARTLDGFGARLRDEVELDSVRADLLGVAGETVRPARASLWLRDRAK